MIGQLLLKLMSALPRYVWYRIKRLFGWTPPAPHQPEPAPAAQPAAPAPASARAAIGLDARYREPVHLPTNRDGKVSAQLEQSELFRLWVSARGGLKWSHYFGIYEEVFAPVRARALKVLEIGVLNGASLALWKRYFHHADTTLVGIDIDPRCSAYEDAANRIFVRIGSQADCAFLDRVVDEFGPFDIIIDDGSHVSSHVITSFNQLYDRGLQDSGIYLVEDLHTTYWPNWRDSQHSFFDLCAELVELMHAHYRAAGADNFFGPRVEDRLEAIEVARITTMIREIRCFDSIVAIHKSRITQAPFVVAMS